MPMPSDSEKNACPSALSRVPGVTTLQSGCRKKLTPAAASGRLRDLTQKTASSRKSRGIRMFESRSIPFCTPHMRMPVLTAIMMNVAHSGFHVVEMYSFILAANTAFISPPAPSNSSPVTDCQRYSHVHPATTM